MRIKYSPQRSDVPLTYTFGTDIVTATLDGIADTFDFSQLPEGEGAIIASMLEPCPVISAKREGGELTVTLRTHHGANPTPAEAFPDEEVI